MSYKGITVNDLVSTATRYVACDGYNLFSGVELSMRSFLVISVSGMGFSAGGSVVPEVT